MTKDHELEWDWYGGTIPENVLIDDTAYCETTFSFLLYRSQLSGGVEYGRGASTYTGTMFDVGPHGRVKIGEYALVVGARIICDSEICIGDYALISWNVVLMDSYRVPFNMLDRRRELEFIPIRQPRLACASVPAKPIYIERNVWIGFDACVLPGVTIGEGSIIGAKSVVTQNIPPFTIAAGNPAQVIRSVNSKKEADVPDSLPRKGKIIVFGILFWYPLAGVTYQFLHYLVGLRRLGYEPYYMEDSARWIYDPRLNDLSPDASGNIEAVLPALQRHGFGDHWAFRGKYPGGNSYGMSETEIDKLYREADAFLNITGAQELRDEHLGIKRRIYVESDPFALQVKVAKNDAGTIRMLDAHDTLFSFGENLGASDCVVPVGKFHWQPTRQPIVLELWDGSGRGGDTFNTITTWHNNGKNIEWCGQTWYWTKDREFEKFLDLPRRRLVKFELAASVDGQVKKNLNYYGWLQRNSIEISREPDRYRDYIWQSRGEFTVARDQYTRPNTGWFSDRSACYLAAGRPVITQETGFSKFLPTGKGLFAFRTMDDILKAVDTIESDYEGHCRAAREIAAEFFAAEKVVGSLMERAGL